MQELPLVTLDTTLGELYARGSGEVDERRIAMVLCAANSEIAPTSWLPRNTKYLYQDSTESPGGAHHGGAQHSSDIAVVAEVLRFI